MSKEKERGATPTRGLCEVEGCPRTVWKAGRCRAHQDRTGLMDDAPGQVYPPEQNFADPETGRPMGTLRLVSETYEYSNGDVRAVIMCADRKLLRLQVVVDGGELWEPRVQDFSSWKALFDEVARMTTGGGAR